MKNDKEKTVTFKLLNSVNNTVIYHALSGENNKIINDFADFDSKGNFLNPKYKSPK